MRRRDFLTSAAALGTGVAVAPVVDALAKDARGVAPARGAKLTPPEEGTLPVAFAISRSTTWIDWVGPQAVFETWRFDPVLKKHVPKFNLFTVGPSLEPVDRLIPDYTYETAPRASIVVVPAQSGSPALLEWLGRVHETADVTMSVCVGAKHLAKAGLLNELSATTHHESIDQFTKDYPRVKWIRGVRFVEEQRISTGGGLTAGIDLALRVVARYFGRDDAQAVADHLEYQGKGWII